MSKLRAVSCSSPLPQRLNSYYFSGNQQKAGLFFQHRPAFRFCNACLNRIFMPKEADISESILVLPPLHQVYRLGIGLNVVRHGSLIQLSWLKTAGRDCLP